MGSRIQADATQEEYEDLLLKNPNLGFLAVVKRRAEDGTMLDDFYLRAGVYDLELQESKRQYFKSLESFDFNIAISQFVPSQLPIPNAFKIAGELETIPIEIIETTPASILANSEDLSSLENTANQISLINPLKYVATRPLIGGISVGHHRIVNPGTLGSKINLQTDGKYFLSNYHVLCGRIGGLGDKIIQPSSHDGGTSPKDDVADLYWYKLDTYTDAAIGRILPGIKIDPGTKCFQISGQTVAQCYMSVKKCGRTTNQTFGTVLSIKATVKVGGYPSGIRTFKNQIQTKITAQGGDSGSILCEAETNKAVGLLFASDSQGKYANHLHYIRGLSGGNSKPNISIMGF